jgi:flagellar biosynthesis anti-sigma factor FlgM
MVDSISGNAGPLKPGSVSARPASPQLSSLPGAQTAAGPARIDQAPPAAAKGQEVAGLVSEGRVAVRNMAREAPVDSLRIAELREAIAGNRYRIDAERIADAMLRSEPGLLKG